MYSWLAGGPKETCAGVDELAGKLQSRVISGGMPVASEEEDLNEIQLKRWGWLWRLHYIDDVQGLSKGCRYICMTGTLFFPEVKIGGLDEKPVACTPVRSGPHRLGRNQTARHRLCKQAEESGLSWSQVFFVTVQQGKATYIGDSQLQWWLKVLLHTHKIWPWFNVFITVDKICDALLCCVGASCLALHQLPPNHPYSVVWNGGEFVITDLKALHEPHCRILVKMRS